MSYFTNKHLEPVNQWVRVNLLMRHLKWVICALLVSNFAFVCVCIYMLNKDTLVVALTESDRLYFVGQRKNIEVNEEDVELAAENFVLERYQWKAYNVESIVRNLSPHLTHGLLYKMTQQLEKSKDFVKKNIISQDIVVQSVKLKEGSVIVNLDRVVSVGTKVKAVRPLEVHLEIVRDTPNKWNLKGLYVNSITEYEK